MPFNSCCASDGIIPALLFEDTVMLSMLLLWEVRSLVMAALPPSLFGAPLLLLMLFIKMLLL
jgi:hypothetical protein